MYSTFCNGIKRSNIINEDINTFYLLNYLGINI